VFTVFYAIFWGTAANAQPKWKAFAWGRFFYNKSTKMRILLSCLLLNAFPVGYFMFMMNRLRDTYWDAQGWRQLLASVAAAFAAFGFYRLWTSVIQLKPTVFYGTAKTDDDETWKRDYPGLTWKDDLNVSYAKPNLLFAIFYILASLSLPLGIRHWPTVTLHWPVLHFGSGMDASLVYGT
jgi:hypothetical protein